MAPVITKAQSGVNTYGVSVNHATAAGSASRTLDSAFRIGAAFKPGKTDLHAGHPVKFRDRTADFYLLLLLCLLLGIIRFSNTRYFYNVLRAFRSTSAAGRELREQIQHAAVPNLGMNVFFGCVAGAYVYYALRMLAPRGVAGYPPALALFVLITGMQLLYAGKWAVVKFSGWAFRLEAITGQYLFNIFLVNKVLGILLLPFVALMALGNPAWILPLLFLSFAVVAAMFLNRYLRSWQTFGSFFQYSGFHFLIYLCASEILPLAVLMKLVTRLL